ncbi:MAG: glycosyltransferase family 9 protein, partial [Chitinophagales bacterium]
MGSIDQSTPLLQTLKQNFPEAKIIFITSSSNEELLEEIHMVDETWKLNDANAISLVSSLLGLISNFFKQRIDLYFDLEVYSYFSTLLTALSRSRRKFGLYRINERMRSSIYDDMMYYSSRFPVSEVYLQLARMIPVKETIESLYNFSETMNGKPLSEFAELKSPYVVVNVNASELRIERRWGAKNFSALINQLTKKFPDHTFVLSGSSGERTYVHEVVIQIKSELINRIIDLSGQLSIKQFLQLLSKSDLMITNDSGPMHLAFALNIRVVALFGPCSPEQYKISEKAVVIYQNVYCSPCVHLFLTPPCGGDNQCMKKISVSDVTSVAERVLLRKDSPSH